MTTRRVRVAHGASVAILVLALALVPAALAARGGGGSGATTGARISFSANPVTVGQQYYVNGSGFRPNTWVTVGAHFADTTWWNSQMTDGQGNLSLAFTATSAGQVYHEAKERGNNGRLRLRATATLSVSAS